MNLNFKHQRSFSIGLLILLGMLAITSSVNVSCGNSKVAEYKKTPPDTTMTWVLAVTPLDWAKLKLNINQGVLFQSWRLTKDTFAFDSTDVNTMKKIWKRDTLYAFEVRIPKIDTSKGQKDSFIYPMLSPKHILQDYNKNPNKP